MQTPGLILLCQGLEEPQFGWLEIVKGAGPEATAVLVFLSLMSMWSLGVMFDRWLVFRAARAESRILVARIRGSLAEGRLADATEQCRMARKSHLAKVLQAGLQEVGDVCDGKPPSVRAIRAAKRATLRAIALTQADLKRGISGLATIGSTAPFVGLLGTVIGIVNSFRHMASARTAGLTVVAGGISEALVATALGLFVALPAVWMFNYFNTRLETFTVEMQNSSSELIDYLLKRVDSSQ